VLKENIVCDYVIQTCNADQSCIELSKPKKRSVCAQGKGDLKNMPRQTPILGTSLVASRTLSAASSPSEASVSPGRVSVARNSGDADEKYLTFMQAVRKAQKKGQKKGAKNESSTAAITPTKTALGLGKLGRSASKAANAPPPSPLTVEVGTPLKSTEGTGLSSVRSSGTVLVSGEEDGNPNGEPVAIYLYRKPESPHSDSSDSVDFEVRSIGNVRSVRKTVPTFPSDRPQGQSLAIEKTDSTDSRDSIFFDERTIGTVHSFRKAESSDTSQQPTSRRGHRSVPNLTQELRALQRYQAPPPQPQARSDSAELSYTDQLKHKLSEDQLQRILHYLS
jgi:hypothetical protein